MIAVTSPPKKLKGEVGVPGDKSISHRAAIFTALAGGTSYLENFLEAEDCMRTVNCLRTLGTEIELKEGEGRVTGKNMRFKPPNGILDAGNSGTTARLLLGVLSGQPYLTRIKGDPSLSRRPMLRVVEPLQRMGAVIQGREGGDKLPLRVKGGVLRPLDYQMQVASAQVKSALMLAGLFAEGTTRIHEPAPTRDHTEKMMKLFGLNLEQDEHTGTLEVKGPASFSGGTVCIPGDFSSAVFLITAAAVVPGSEVTIKGVGINSTRTGALEVLQKMGAFIEIHNYRYYGEEPVGDLHVKGEASLKGINIDREIIPWLIDEIPVLCVAALAAEGRTVIKGAEELRVKETDRIAALALELSRFGAEVKERPDGLEIEGGKELQGTTCYSHGDHRMAMALAVAGLMASGETGIQDFEAANISFPGFLNTLRQLLEK